MGEPVHVAEHATARRGVVRFETDRPLSGMGHRSYRSVEDVHGDDAPDRVADVLFATGSVEYVHVFGNIVTVELSRGGTSEGLREALEALFVHYEETEPPEGWTPEPDEPAEAAAAAE